MLSQDPHHYITAYSQSPVGLLTRPRRFWTRVLLRCTLLLMIALAGGLRRVTCTDRRQNRHGITLALDGYCHK